MVSRNPSRMNRHSHGFTLLELLIAIAVVGLVVTLALPSFLGSVRKSRRAEAFTALSAVQLKQERWRANNQSYASSLTGTWPTTGSAQTGDGLALSDATPHNYYSIAIVSSSASDYEATATAVSGSSQAQDGSCGKLGVKMTAGNLSYGSAAAADSLTYSAADKCWSR